MAWKILGSQSPERIYAYSFYYMRNIIIILCCGFAFFALPEKWNYITSMGINIPGNNLVTWIHFWQRRS